MLELNIFVDFIPLKTILEKLTMNKFPKNTEEREYNFGNTNLK